MKLSIIIATHDRPQSLERLLESLGDIGADQELEVFIAENGTPSPARLSTKFTSLGNLVHLHEAHAGKCRIQNRAIVKARGEILTFLDDDLTAGPGYILAVRAFFSSHPEFAAMAGRILPAEDPLAKVTTNWVYLDLPVVDHGQDVGEVRGVMGANMAFRAAALKQVGPFDERLGPGAGGHEEETEMSSRLRRAGFRIGYAPEAVVYHEVDPSRADRARFIRVSRERGRCRMLHEHHGRIEAMTKCAVAWSRLQAARAVNAGPERIAREERRLAVALGMYDVLSGHASDWINSLSSRP